MDCTLLTSVMSRFLPKALAMAPAAKVFPVPGGPENSMSMPGSICLLTLPTTSMLVSYNPQSVKTESTFCSYCPNPNRMVSFISLGRMSSSNVCLGARIVKRLSPFKICFSRSPSVAGDFKMICLTISEAMRKSVPLLLKNEDSVVSISPDFTNLESSEMYSLF